MSHITMSNLFVSRSTLLFEESIRSKYTKRNYISHLREFERFSGLDGAKISFAPRHQLQKLLEDYLIHLKHTANPNSIPSKFQGIRHFCIMNQINLNWDIIRKMFPQKQKTQNLRSYTTKQIQEMLSCTNNLRDTALIHFLASTGARIGVFDHILSIKHLRKTPYRCSAVKLYAGHIEEYWAFLTPQATKALQNYHNHRRQKEIFCDDTPIFTTQNHTSTQLGWNGARSAIYRIISQSKIDRCKQGIRYEVQADHGFRKRFNTILKLDNAVNYNIAEKLMGHKNGLDGVYFVPTLDELFAEFRKIIPKLKV